MRDVGLLRPLARRNDRHEDQVQDAIGRSTAANRSPNSPTVSEVPRKRKPPGFNA